MKGAAIAGLFLLVGLAAGSLAAALAGKAGIEQLRRDMQAADEKTAALSGKLVRQEAEITRLTQQVYSNLLSIEDGAGRLARLSEQVASLAKSHEEMSQTQTRETTFPGAAQGGVPGTLPGGSPAMEDLKEEVKKELKEERQKEEIRRRQKWAEQSKEMQTREWRRKLDEEYPELVRKLNLSVNQEISIKEIAENAFNQIIELMQEMLGKPEDEADWLGFQEKIEKIYKDAESKITQQVTPEQAEKLKEFFGRP